MTGATLHRLVAPNPDPYTLSGTNTWIVVDDDTGTAVLVDPGPDDGRHLEAIVSTVEQVSQGLSAVVLTHGHDDHSDLVAPLHRRLPVPVHAVDPAFAIDTPPLEDGQVIGVGDGALRCVAAPGHSWDSVCFHAPALGALFTGDTYLGGTSTMIDYPDGSLTDYLASLEQLIGLAGSSGIHRLLPGHGSDSLDPVRDLTGYLAHRRVRLAEVEAALRSGDPTDEQIVDLLYPGLDEVLREGAVQNTAAAREHLTRDRQPGAGAMTDDQERTGT